MTETLLTFLIATMFFSFNYGIWFSGDFKGFFQISIGMGTGFVLITASSFISGKREYGIISAVLATAFGAFIGDFIIREVIMSPYFDSGVGTFIAYFSLSILVALIAGYTGGSLAERRFLFPSAAKSK